MKRSARLTVLILAALAGCAGVEPAQDSSPPPERLVAHPGAVPVGRVLTWGGVILDTRNLAARSVLEVLAYPLARDGRPMSGAEPQGRFLADRRGYLEPLEYAPGRWITVNGPLLGYTQGKVGERWLNFPALDARELRLWQDIPSAQTGPSPRVSVGVGVGSYGSSVGVGVGF